MPPGLEHIDREANNADHHYTILTQTRSPNKPLALQYLIIAYWVIDMAEQGVICVGEQSSFSRAWDIMAEVLVSVDDKFDEMAEKAATGAIHLGNALRAEGLFRAPA